MDPIKSALFVKSSSQVEDCPEPDKPEYAFIGRSNVGKSSLINMLTSHGKLAKVSSRPGKTQLINHFLINGKWYLVDLPGYGWARVSKSEQSKWKKMTERYFRGRTNLTCVFILIDSRLDPQQIDLDFVNTLGQNGIPIVLVFTKADKLGINKSQSNVAKFKKAMKREWEVLPPSFLTSAEKGYGREELLNYIDQINQDIKT